MSCQIRVLAAMSWLGLGMGAIAAEPIVNAAARTEALHLSLEHSVVQCREWIEAKDLKSLAQTADGMKLLAQVLQAKSDDVAWQQATGLTIAAGSEIQSAARSENLPAATAALERAAESIAAARKLTPSGQPQPQQTPRGSNLRQLMMLLDNLRGQAKIALLTGEAGNAKQAAVVLAELGPLVSNARGGDDWAIMSHDFTQASLAAASSTESDTARLKPLFKAMSQACDHCHDAQ